MKSLTENEYGMRESYLEHHIARSLEKMGLVS